ncbi:MAG: hypothetical protein ACJ74O_01530 [Frankiaceae bacterium]
MNRPVATAGTAHGDTFYVCDTHADGKGAQLDWKTADGLRNGSFRDSEGASTCVGKNVNLAEGSLFYYRVCLVDNGVETSTCTAWKYDYA